MSTPLPVYYPDGGRLLLMRWWTDADRGHVVLARSESAMRLVAQRVFRCHPDASLREYLEVEIVAPSLRLCALAAEHTQRERIENFRTEMTWRMREACEAGRTLPTPFSVCGVYEPEEEEKPSSEEAGEWARRTHYGCRHCKDGIVLAISAKELHGRFAAAWQARQPTVGFEHARGLVASRARVADEWERCPRITTAARIRAINSS